MRIQAGVIPGQKKWWCSACMNSWTATNHRPEICPNGHAAEVYDDLAPTGVPSAQADD